MADTPAPSERPTPVDDHSAVLVTATGKHPAIVVRPPSAAATYTSHAVDLVVALGILVLIFFDKVSPAEGLPWLTLILGVKLRAARGKPPAAGSGVGSIAALLTAWRGP